MADLQQLLDATEARRKLWAIPGVEAIGFGLKEKAGEVVPEYVFRVYVRLKKPLSELRPEEVIPPEVDGFKTDVVVLQETQPTCRTVLKPGQKITRDIPNTTQASGTLGCMVRKAGKVYALTNHHVVVPEFGGAASNDVYQPERSTCAGSTCNSPVATVVGEEAPWAVEELKSFGPNAYWLDCALIELVSGVGYVGEVEGIGNLVSEINDLAAIPGGPGPGGSMVPNAPIPIHKRGAVTKVTHGVVVELCREQMISGTLTIVWELLIKPTTGHAYSETYRISADEPIDIALIPGLFAGRSVTATRLAPADPSDRRIRFQGTTFVLKGDSGSLCVDDSRKAAGLLYAAKGVSLNVEGEARPVFVPNGEGVACHIRPVLLALGLAPESAIVTSSSTTSGAPVLVPGDELAASPGDGLARLGSVLEATAAGRHLLEVFRAHRDELLALINHRRRVTVAWQRNKGPAFVAATLNALREGDTTLPKTVAGHPIETLLERMDSALQREGSAALRSAIDAERDNVFRVVRECVTFEDLANLLEEEPARRVAS